MNKRAVFYVIGRLLQLQGGALLAPLGIALADEGWLLERPLLACPNTLAFLAAMLICFAAGTALVSLFRVARYEQGAREGFAIVALGWVTLALVGSIPFVIYFVRHRTGPDGALAVAITDAFFEVMSGFTTTGATIVTDVEALPRGLLFWRSLTHWLGGMGIITLALAIFPAMGVAGYQMFRGEVPGPSADRLRPRLAETAKILWGVYALLSAAETLLLLLGGMNWFDALCHTFGTMATGGFSTRNASIGAYNSTYIDIVVTIFMLAAGINFLIHYRIIFRGDWRVTRRDGEFALYAGVFAAAVIFTASSLCLERLPAPEVSARHFQFAPRTTAQFEGHVAAEQARVGSIGGALHHAAFQVASILTTTGYCTADFDVWPRQAAALLVVLMFCGGCAGSTGGGMKIIRVLIASKAAWRELRKVVQPRLVAPLKVRGTAVPEGVVTKIAGFVLLYVGLFVVGSIVMAIFIDDLTTAVSSVAATIGNIGPGLAGVGPTQTYAWIPLPGKWVLCLCMLLGRLEILTVLVVLRPSFWRQ